MVYLEPVKETKSHELGIVIEGFTELKEVAEQLTLFVTRQIFYEKLPDEKGTADTASFVVDDIIHAGRAYIIKNFFHIIKN